MNIRIRPCRSEDLEAVLNLQKTWVQEDITIGMGADSLEDLSNQLNHYFYVVEKDGRLVGYGHGRVHEADNMAVFEDQEKYFELEDLYLVSGERQRGLGSLLLSEIMDRVKADGVERFLLYSSTKNLKPLINFYEGHGFKTWHVKMYL